MGNRCARTIRAGAFVAWGIGLAVGLTAPMHASGETGIDAEAIAAIGKAITRHREALDSIEIDFEVRITRPEGDEGAEAIVSEWECSFRKCGDRWYERRISGNTITTRVRADGKAVTRTEIVGCGDGPRVHVEDTEARNRSEWAAAIPMFLAGHELVSPGGPMNPGVGFERDRELFQWREGVGDDGAAFIELTYELPGGAAAHILRFCPEHAYAVTRYETVRPGPSRGQPAVVRAYAYGELTAVADGLFVPMAVTYSQKMALRGPLRTLTTHTVRATRIEANGAIPEEYFDTGAAMTPHAGGVFGKD